MFSAEKWYEKNISFKFGCWNDSRRTKSLFLVTEALTTLLGWSENKTSPWTWGHFTTHRTCQTLICFHQEKMWWSKCWRIEFNTIPSTNTFLWLTTIWIDETTWMSWCDWGGRGRCSRKGGVEVLTPLELFYKGSQSPPVLSWSALVRLEALGGRERGGGPNEPPVSPSPFAYTSNVGQEQNR